MAGLSLNTGLGASVFANGGYPGAATPAAAGATPQGPTSIGQKAFGIVTGNEGGLHRTFFAAAGGGLLSLGLLVFIWWSLPRLGDLMRVTLAGVIVGALLYWGVQHFTGFGSTGKGSK